MQIAISVLCKFVFKETYDTVDSKFVSGKFCNKVFLVGVPYSDHGKVATFASDLEKEKKS
jgi:hypothetical protein